MGNIFTDIKYAISYIASNFKERKQYIKNSRENNEYWKNREQKGTSTVFLKNFGVSRGAKFEENYIWIEPCDANGNPITSKLYYKIEKKESSNDKEYVYCIERICKLLDQQLKSFKKYSTTNDEVHKNHISIICTLGGMAASIALFNSLMALLAISLIGGAALLAVFSVQLSDLTRKKEKIIRNQEMTDAGLRSILNDTKVIKTTRVLFEKTPFAEYKTLKPVEPKNATLVDVRDMKPSNKTARASVQQGGFAYGETHNELIESHLKNSITGFISQAGEPKSSKIDLGQYMLVRKPSNGRTPNNGRG